MKALPTFLQQLLNWIVTLITPVFILLTALRLLLTPLFIQLEYRTPNFPADQYGFSMEDRLKWAPFALEYLVNDEGVEFLGDLKFEDGSPLYNERELSHMVDVKNLVKAGLWVWLAFGMILAGLGIWAWRAVWLADFLRMLASGGKLTITLILIMIVFILISFNQLFTGFHRIFFEGDSWLFYYSETLIRLFPIRFWRDAFASAGALTFLGGLFAWRIGRKPKGMS